MPPRIIFLRHGETDWNAEARLQGQQDTPLNARGRDQARSVGRALRDWFRAGGPDIGALDFIASPLSRTRETMELARESMGLPPGEYSTDPRLIELSFGRWEGLTWNELKAIDPWAATAREGVKLYAELQLKALEALRVDSVEKALTILEGQARTVVRSAERMQTSAEQTGKSIQETCAAAVAKIKDVCAQI